MRDLDPLFFDGELSSPWEAKSDGPSRTLSPPAMQDTEVSFQRPPPVQAGADETVRKVLEDNNSDVVERGMATPMTTEGGGFNSPDLH